MLHVFIILPGRDARASSIFSWLRRVACLGAGAVAICVSTFAGAFPDDDEIAICPAYGVQNADACVNDAQETPNPETGKCDGGGEDFYAVNSTFHPFWKARGIYYEVFDWDTRMATQFEPNSGLARGTTNLDNGCVAISEETLNGATRLAVRLYLDARLKGITVRVRGDVDSSDDFGTGSSPMENGQNVGGRCGTNPLEPDPDATGLAYCQPNEQVLPVNAGNNGFPQDISPGERYNVSYNQDELNTLMALTQFPVFWWNQNLDILKVEDPEFNPDNEVVITVLHRDYVNSSGCTAEFPCSATGWIHDEDEGGPGEIEINIQTQWPRYNKKFLIGHEVGHAMEMIWSRRNKSVVNSAALFGNLGYDLDDSEHPAACTAQSASVSHGLTTVEYVSAAANEGFAHFFAADAYNDHTEGDGKFNYYKIEDDFGFERDVYLDDLVSQRESVCGGGGNAGSLGNGAGVEADWLRFFWNFHAWLNAQDGFRSILDPDFDGDDAVAEARAQDVMMALHAGVIIDSTSVATPPSSVDSEAFYDLLVARLCEANSEFVTFIEKLDVDIDTVRAMVFEFVEDFGVWTGGEYAPGC